MFSIPLLYSFHHSITADCKGKRDREWLTVKIEYFIKDGKSLNSCTFFRIKYLRNNNCYTKKFGPCKSLQLENPQRQRELDFLSYINALLSRSESLLFRQQGGSHHWIWVNHQARQRRPVAPAVRRIRTQSGLSSDKGQNKISLKISPRIRFPFQRPKAIKVITINYTYLHS